MRNGKKYNFRNSILRIFEKHEFFLILGMSIILGIMTVHKMFSLNNYPIFYRDFSWPSDIGSLKNWLFYSWSDIGNSQNIDVLHRLPFNFILYIIALLFGSYNAYASLYLFITAFGLFSMYLLIRFITKKFYHDNPIIHIASSYLGAFTWIFSFTYMNNLGVELGITFIPLSILFFLKSFWDKISFKNIFILSFSLFLSTAADVRYFVLTIILIFFFIISEITRHNTIITFKNAGRILLSVLSLVILFSSYWIFPSIFIYMNGEKISTSYIISDGLYDMLSSKFSPYNYIRLLGYWWPYISVDYIDGSFILSILSFSIPIIAFLSLILIGDKRIKILFGLILISSILGIMANKSFIYLPLINWMFRTPYRWLIFLNFVYSSMLSLFAIEIYMKNKKIFVLYLFFIIMVNTILTFPLLSGDFGGHMSPLKISKDIYNIYIDENDIYKNDIYHILFFPPIDFGRSLRPIPYYQLLSTNHIGVSSPELSISDNFFAEILNEAILTNNTDLVMSLLQIHNFRYYIINNNSNSYSKYERKVINYAKSDNNFGRHNNTYIYYANESGEFNIYSHITVKSGIDIDDKDKDLPLFPLDYKIFPDLYLLIYDKNFKILSKDIDIILSFMLNDKGTNNETKLLIPYEKTLESDYKKGWAKTSTLPFVNIEPITNIIFDQNFKHIDFDYGKGFVYTDIQSRPILIKFNIENDDMYEIFPRIFFSKIGGELIFKIDNRSYNIYTKTSRNRLSWQDIGSMYLNKGDHELEIINGGGLNVVNIIAIIPKRKFDDTKRDVVPILDQKQKIPDSISKGATILNYIKINPTHYNIKINASEPFILSFAESYDPLWTAYIDKIDGKIKSEKFYSIPLYGMVNGFFINQSGNLDIIINYDVQDWFIIGSTISIITVIICVYIMKINNS